MKVCRFCNRPIQGTTERSRNWLCKACGKFDASECLTCGTTAEFPRTPTISVEEAAKSPFAVHVSSTVGKTGIERILAKELVYCRKCFHGAYFVATEGDIMRCVLCQTSWSRFESAVHKENV